MRLRFIVVPSLGCVCASLHKLNPFDHFDLTCCRIAFSISRASSRVSHVATCQRTPAGLLPSISNQAHTPRLRGSAMRMIRYVFIADAFRVVRAETEELNAVNQSEDRRGASLFALCFSITSLSFFQCMPPTSRAFVGHTICPVAGKELHLPIIGWLPQSARENHQNLCLFIATRPTICQLVAVDCDYFGPRAVQPALRFRMLHFAHHYAPSFFAEVSLIHCEARLISRQAFAARILSSRSPP